MKISNNQKQTFQRTVWNHYKKHGRDLPWRNTTNPYEILISEIMLQQTQVSRVLKKYPEFLNVFPAVKDLAKSDLSSVLSAWQGMGYNRRGKALHELAKILISRHNGAIPKDREALLTLPGIGPSTAGGVLAFAYNKPVVFIETNIRRVFIHHFFKEESRISDGRIFPLVEQTLSTTNPREWYYALFDYGSELAKTTPNPNHKSAHYTKQSPFEGSHRQLRSFVLKTLLNKKASNLELISTTHKLKRSKQEINKTLKELEKEGFIMKQGKYFTLKQ